MKKKSEEADALNITIEDNLKKAVSEMLILFLLKAEDMSIASMLEQMEIRSKGLYTISYPYAILYRLQALGFLREAEKRIDLDGRRRQFFSITEAGSRYLNTILSSYTGMTQGITSILNFNDGRGPVDG